MNLEKLFEAQRVLDQRIEKEHPLIEGENRIAKKILALQVELGEMANEWRGFKFWSKNQKPQIERKVVCHACNGKGSFIIDIRSRKIDECLYCNGSGYEEDKNPLLEEAVDVLHFILSIGNEMNFDKEYFSVFVTTSETLEGFADMFYKISRFESEGKAGDYYRMLDSFVNLTHSLNFTWEEIEEAYFEKNQINHQRQQEGY